MRYNFSVKARYYTPPHITILSLVASSHISERAHAAAISSSKFFVRPTITEIKFCTAWLYSALTWRKDKFDYVYTVGLCLTTFLVEWAHLARGALYKAKRIAQILTLEQYQHRNLQVDVFMMFSAVLNAENAEAWPGLFSSFCWTSPASLPHLSPSHSVFSIRAKVESFTIRETHYYKHHCHRPKMRPCELKMLSCWKVVSFQAFRERDTFTKKKNNRHLQGQGQIYLFRLKWADYKTQKVSKRTQKTKHKNRERNRENLKLGIVINSQNRGSNEWRATGLRFAFASFFCFLFW